MANIAANYAIGVPQSVLLAPLDQVFIPTRGLAVEVSALSSGVVAAAVVYRVCAVSDNDPFQYWDSPAVLCIEGDALDPGVTNLRNATPSAPASIRLPAGYAGFIISVEGSALTLNWTLRCPKMAPSQWEP